MIQALSLFVLCSALHLVLGFPTGLHSFGLESSKDYNVGKCK